MKKNLLFVAPIFALILGVGLLGIDAPYYAVQIFFGSLFLSVLIKRSIEYGGGFFYPLPLVSAVFLWSMVFSPVVGAATGVYLSIPPKQIDFEKWNLITSLIYLECIFLFFIGAYFSVRPMYAGEVRTARCFSGSFYKFGSIILLVSAISQLYVYWQSGGVIGYMIAWTYDRETFSGQGITFMVSEVFPIVFAMLSLVYLKNKVSYRGAFIILAIFAVFFILKILFGGLRGSRSNTVWGVFWFAGIVHLYYRPLNMRYFLAGFAFLFLFMVGYSLYKSYGVEVLSGNVTVEDSGRYQQSPILEIAQGDFSRAGVHAFILHEYFSGGYQLKFGQTYMQAIFKVIPFFDSPFGAYDKNAAGAELFYGKVFDPSLTDYHNSRIYGLYGEGLMNFGFFFAPFLFLAFGFLVGKIDNFCRSLELDDPRVLIVPFVSNAAVVLALVDLDNFIFFFVKNGLIAVLLVYLGSVHVSRKRRFQA